MATASIDLPNGAKVQVEGTAEDINKILALCGAVKVGAEADRVDSVTQRVKGKRGRQVARSAPAVRRVTGGAMQQIRELIDDAFFQEKRSISHVQQKLEELGHIYPLTHLSTPLRRLVKNKELRRMREDKNWVYVNA